MHGPKRLPWLCRAKSEAPSTKRTLPKRSHHRARCRQILCPGFGPKKDKRAQTTTRRGKTIKGRWKRWCPVKACNYLGCNLPEHLQNKHRMKPGSAVYKLSLKVARRYQGLEEELRIIEPNVSQPSIPSPDSTTTKDKKVSPS